MSEYYHRDLNRSGGGDFLRTAGVVFLIILSVVLVGALILFVVTPMSIQNSIADSENMVINAKEDCVTTRDNGIKSIIENANVDRDTKDYLKSLVSNPKSNADKQKVDSAYNELLNDNPAPFMLLMGAVGNTDFTVTSQNLQREISARRSEMIGCSKMLNGAQTNLRNVAGMNAAGDIVKWPNSMFNIYPSEVVDEDLQDNDHDGRLTVLDYRSPVSLKTRKSFGSGVDEDVIIP